MQRSLRERKRSAALWFCLGTFSIALQFVSGFPQVALINLIPFGLISIAGVAFWNRTADMDSRATIRAVLQSLGITALSVGLGIGIAAVQLLPAAELLNLSVRAQELGAEF